LREQFLGLSKKLKDNGYSNDMQDWTDAWYADMKDASKQKIFGFFSPAWLINYVMAGNSGKTETEKGTYGDWAVCDATVGFSWGGTWVLANKDTKLKKTVSDIINWITLDSSDTGLQYFWANGTLNGPGGTKDAVASGTVMKKSDGKLDFLGGQNMFDVFVPAGVNATGKNKTQYDESINTVWRVQVREYTSGKKDRATTIKDFKQQVLDNLGIAIE
jgi:multiple sugar transport system substrate-binding protein